MYTVSQFIYKCNEIFSIKIDLSVIEEIQNIEKGKIDSTNVNKYDIFMTKDGDVTRPAVILTLDMNDGLYSAIPISTRRLIKSGIYYLKLSLQKYDLVKDGTASIDKPIMLSKDKLINKIGHLDNGDIDRITRMINECFVLYYDLQ